MIELGEGQYKIYDGKLITIAEAEAIFNRQQADAYKEYIQVCITMKD